MKIIFVVLFIVFSTGCVSTYQGATSKDVAYISVPKSKTDYKFIGGFSGQNVTIGDINEKGCMVNVAKVNDNSLNAEGKLIVPAGREIGLAVSAYQGNTSCGLGMAVTLEVNKEYLLSFGQGGRMCGIGVSEIGENQKLAPVKSERLLPGFSKLCKK